jgi:hypothetical protein
MIDLEFLGVEILKVDRAAASGQFDESGLERLREGGSTPEPGEPGPSGTAKSVCADRASVTASDSEYLEEDALLSHIPGRPRRVVVAIQVLQLLGGNMAMLENVLDDCAR